MEKLHIGTVVELKGHSFKVTGHEIVKVTIQGGGKQTTINCQSVVLDTKNTKHMLLVNLGFSELRFFTQFLFPFFDQEKQCFSKEFILHHFTDSKLIL